MMLKRFRCWVNSLKSSSAAYSSFNVSKCMPSGPHEVVALERVAFPNKKSLWTWSGKFTTYWLVLYAHTLPLPLGYNLLAVRNVTPFVCALFLMRHNSLPSMQMILDQSGNGRVRPLLLRHVYTFAMSLSRPEVLFPFWKGKFFLNHIENFPHNKRYIFVPTGLRRAFCTSLVPCLPYPNIAIKMPAAAYTNSDCERKWNVKVSVFFLYPFLACLHVFSILRPFLMCVIWLYTIIICEACTVYIHNVLTFVGYTVKREYWMYMEVGRQRKKAKNYNGKRMRTKSSKIN